MKQKPEPREKPSVEMAAKIREAGRRACRQYCQLLPDDLMLLPRWPCLMIPCWHCDLIKGGMDCQGNPIGTRDARIAAARAAVVELPSVRHSPKQTYKHQPEEEVGKRKGRPA